MRRHYENIRWVMCWIAYLASVAALTVTLVRTTP